MTIVTINSEQDLENIFVSADHHLGHANIIKYTNRPFKDVDEMDEVLISNWNKVVGSNNLVFYLADLTLGDIETAAGYFKQLNGKIFVLANNWHHDKRWLPKNFLGPMVLEYPDYVHSIGHVEIIFPLTVLEIPSLGKDGHPLAITLCHYPLAVWDRKHYGGWHLHGHCHGSYQYSDNDYVMDVGVDCTDYQPINLKDIKNTFDGFSAEASRNREGGTG